MRAGLITVITTSKDRFTFCLQNEDGESSVDVYKTEEARLASLGDYIWTQSGNAYLTPQDSNLMDIKLWLIRQDDGDPEPWLLEEAMSWGKAHG